MSFYPSGEKAVKPVSLVGVSSEGVPSTVSSGSLVPIYLDTYGRLVTSGYDNATGSNQYSNVAPELSQNIQSVLLFAVTSTGSSTAINIVGYNKVGVHITASSVATGGTLNILASYDDSSYGKVPIANSNDMPGIACTNGTITISTTGTYYIPLPDIKTNYIKANLATRTDGTYTVSVVGGR